MLAEKRYEAILELLAERKSITVFEINDILKVSESTIRRDLTTLHNAGKLVKVFGGAVSVPSDSSYNSFEPSVAQKADINTEEKKIIARYAASLIEPSDFVYLDAGTTTGCMIEYITQREATFVTNAVDHAKRLALSGFKVLLIGGDLKASTEAVVGSRAILNIQEYHFTKGFFGTNGVSVKAGYTTPDAGEALVKKTALEHAQKCFVLCDYQKFGMISSVTYAAFNRAVVLTDRTPKEPFNEYSNVQKVPGIEI